MARTKKDDLLQEPDPLWHKDAIIYELHVKAFADGNGDGIGDFKGLTEKLDYLQDLGITALWLLPFCPSPLKDDGYDISDYTGIHPSYGSLHDLRILLSEAHKRGLRVITELVLNHTSDQHPWFQRARRADPGTRWRNYYVWSDTPDRYQDARIIFQDFESSNWAWDPVAKAYYWHRFYYHQPDLNYDNPEVHAAVFRAIDFWFELGVDGLRLDAVPYLYEREGTNCENLPETYGFLEKLRDHVDRRFSNRLLLAEANQWPEDAVAYFGKGNRCHMAFHFPLMPRMFMALRMEDRFPIMDILDQTPPIPETCQWALFLRNHDELTLEMVTDEERDYMYRVYAQDPRMRLNLGIRRRLAPLLGNHRRRIELMHALLLSMPGTPVVYYGDEIGMGDNVYLGDRDGVRTPMQWSPDRNGGFSRANPQKLYLPIIIDPEYHFQTVNVEAQQNSPHSLLWWVKRLITIRKRFKAFGRGTIAFIQPENRKVLAFVRQYEDERLLVVANLSRFVQYAELDLTRFAGMLPVEVFGGTRFPPISEQPYLMTLGPHSFYWFSLEPGRASDQAGEIESRLSQLPRLTLVHDWQTALPGGIKTALERLLSGYFQQCRWFGGKARRIRSLQIQDSIPVTSTKSAIFLVGVEYVEGNPETYVFPAALAEDTAAESILGEQPAAVLARVGIAGQDKEAILFDASVDSTFADALLAMIARHRKAKGRKGMLEATHTGAFGRLLGKKEMTLKPSICRAEQSNTSILFGDRFILKLFRRLEPGINPDLEIGRFLTGQDFANAPSVAGAIEYRTPSGPSQADTLAILHEYVRNEADAWSYTKDVLVHYLEKILVARPEPESLSVPAKPLFHLVDEDMPAVVSELIGPYLGTAGLLGKRTAELHVALSSAPENEDFAPKPFSRLYQRALYQGMRASSTQVFQLLKQRLHFLPEGVRADAGWILEEQGRVLNQFQKLLSRKINALRIRCHGDYHLGQVLYTGNDFVIIDFEGEPARSIGERRIKRSALRDVAGMIRSFSYAAYTTLFSWTGGGTFRSEDFPYMESCARYWQNWVSLSFLKAYLSHVAVGGLVPREREEAQVLLDIYLLDKALYELSYELNNRPDWTRIPLLGIRELLERAI